MGYAVIGTIPLVSCADGLLALDVAKYLSDDSKGNWFSINSLAGHNQYLWYGVP